MPFVRCAATAAIALTSSNITSHVLAEEPAKFVGGQVCSGCHAAETESWQGSHHALAMQKVTETTVLGDFANVRFEHLGAVTTFSRSSDKFTVNTEGPDGALHDYEIAYTFGVYPLQQYLIAFPGGRYQALGIAWDSRPKDQGGQRWFQLYPGQQLKPGDSTALDRARPDLELPVRRLPLHRSEEELRPRRRHLCDHLDRPRRGLRGVPRSGLSARRLDQGAGRRRLLPAGHGRCTDGPDELAEADRHRPLGDEPGDRHRPAHRETGVDRARDLCGLSLAAQSDRQEPEAW